MRIISRESLSSLKIDFWLIKELSNYKIGVVDPIVLKFTEHNDSFMLPDPTFSITREEAQSICQSMIDELTKMGYRPNTDRLAGELESQTKHLKDLQKIVDIFMNVIERKGI